MPPINAVLIVGVIQIHTQFFPLGLGGFFACFDLIFCPRLDDEAFGYELPKVFYFVIASFEMLGDTLLNLIAAVGTTYDNDVCAGLFNLLLFVASMPCGFHLERHGPHSTTSTAAIVLFTVGSQFDEIINTLLYYPARFIKESFAERACEFATMFA